MGQKIYFRNSGKDERLGNWRRERAAYNEWRWSPEGIKFVMKRRKDQSNLCFICLEPLGRGPVHIDHIFPLFVGGTNARANLCVTHPRCNMQKGATVTMTYKEACKRRRLFNKIERGVALRGARRPACNSRQRTCIKISSQYFPDLSSQLQAEPL